jgi:CubicO group peptidase (beta-lactamase class C family)
MLVDSYPNGLTGSDLRDTVLFAMKESSSAVIHWGTNQSPFAQSCDVPVWLASFSGSREGVFSSLAGRLVVFLEGGRLPRITFVSILCLCLLAPRISHTAPSNELEEYMDTQVRAGRFSGAVLVARGGKVLVAKPYGLANIELNVRNDLGSKFRLGAITQQFTAMAILELQEAGRLSIEDSACKYIPNCPNDWREIKVVNLLTHTSGISNFTELPNSETTNMMPTTVPELLAHLETKSLEFRPGERFEYSNSGYQLLGAIVENVSGETYAKYLSAHIFEPLQMRDTGYDSSTKIVQGRASGYKRDEAKKALQNATYVDISTVFSAGGLYSTVEDLYRWDRALYGEKLVSQQLVEKMVTPHRDGYGFGWKVLKEFQRRALMSVGRINGFSAAIRRYPEDDTCVIVLGNWEDIDAEKISHDLGALSFDVHTIAP